MHDNEVSTTRRITVPALEAIMDRTYPVLNDGFIRVVDYMGGDESVVQAARVAYGKGTKSVSDDKTLIRFLMRHRHTTPTEMATIKLHVRVPMDCWRQWIRHRTASVNEYSTRYSEAIDSQQKTFPDRRRTQSTTNKQGSGVFIDKEAGLFLTEEEEDFHARARKLYEDRLVAGVAREQARKDLPLSTYTESYWKMDLHNLLHFLGLRMDEHAQAEIREYALIIGHEIVSKWVPFTWGAFLDYRFNAASFSRAELLIAETVNNGMTAEAKELIDRLGKRELSEAQAKLARIGIHI